MEVFVIDLDEECVNEYMFIVIYVVIVNLIDENVLC